MSATSSEAERPLPSPTGSRRAVPRRSWPARLAPIFRQVAALGVLALAVRSSYSLGSGALEHFDRAPTEGGGKRGRGSGWPNGPDLPSAPEQASGELSAFGAPRAKKSGAVHPRRLIVDVGTDRSDVYVDGRRVGQVPYVGEWACSSDAVLEITIVPALGVPSDYRVPCRGEDITVRSEQQVRAAE